MPKPKRRTTSSALLGDAPVRSSLIIDGEKHSNMSYADLKAILDAKLEG